MFTIESDPPCVEMLYGGPMTEEVCAGCYLFCGEGKSCTMAEQTAARLTRDEEACPIGYVTEDEDLPF